MRIRINSILVSASSDILFDPLKAKRKLLSARKIRFFTSLKCNILTSHSETQSDLAPYLFSSATFVFNPFKELPLHFSQNEVLRILMSGALFQREKLPGCRPGLAHVQPFVTTKTTGKSRGLTSLDFAQLGPVRPSGPPYLH